MAKSKKKRQQDFQKVKLKVGKKLPKGDNVTNLSFKTRQIKVAQKIKVDDGKTPLTRNNLSISDLLRQCDHHSSTVRVNAVSGLKELWINYSSDLMMPNNVNGYGIILKKLSTLLIDNEAVVRHTVLNFFKIILTKLAAKESENQKPHYLGGGLFTYIHTYLCCAMNHIHEDIKLDSLLLFDCLLDTFPTLIIQQTGDLLKNLVGLISTPSFIGSKGSTIIQKLSLNPESKLTAMKYRAKVLQRIKQTFVEAVNAESKSKDTKENESHELDDYITNPSTFESFLTLSVPMLLQCWKEARASIDHDSSDVYLQADSSEVMSLVTSIIQLMFILNSTSQKHEYAIAVVNLPKVAPELLVSNFLQDFEDVFMKNFPYAAKVLLQLPKKRKADYSQLTFNNEAAQQSMNLALCDIMCTFYSDVSHKPDKSIKRVRDYIQRNFAKTVSTEHCRVFVRILTNIFINPHSLSFFAQSYKSALKCYLSCPVKSSQKYLFYKLFSFMTEVWDGWENTGAGPQPVATYQSNKDIQDVIMEFLKDLPKLLMQVVQSDNKTWLLEIFILLKHFYSRTSQPSFRELLWTNLIETIDFQGILTKLESKEIQRQLFSFLSLGLPLTKDILKPLLHCMRRPVEKPVIHHTNIVCYGIDSIILNARELLPLKDQVEFNKMNQHQHILLSDYLRFLFSVQIGFVSEEVDMFFPVDPLKEETDLFTVDFKVEGDQWLRHVEMANVVAKELANFYIPASPAEGYKQAFSFINDMELLWKKTYSKRRKIHVLTVYSLVRLCYETSFPHVLVRPNPSFYDFTGVIVVSTLLELFGKDVSVTEAIKHHIKSELILCLSHCSSLLCFVTSQLHKVVEENSMGSSLKCAAETCQEFLKS